MDRERESEVMGIPMYYRTPNITLPEIRLYLPENYIKRPLLRTEMFYLYRNKNFYIVSYYSVSTARYGVQEIGYVSVAEHEDNIVIHCISPDNTVSEFDKHYIEQCVLQDMKEHCVTVN